MFSSTTPAQVVAPEATAPPALNERIEHITEIHAPIEKVWEALIDIDNWDWNKVIASPRTFTLFFEDPGMIYKKR